MARAARKRPARSMQPQRAKGQGPAPSGPAPAADAGTITTEVAARLIMVSAERVRQLTKQGHIARMGRDRYRVVDVVQGYIGYLKDEQRRTSKSASASRVQDARAREIELRTAREEHRLIETDEAIGVCDELVGAYKVELAGLPARLTRDIDLRRKIEVECDDICRRVADRFAEKASALRSTGEAQSAYAEDDAG